MHKLRYILFVLLLLASAPAFAQEAPTTNLTEGCVSDFDPEVNYFPEQVSITEAENLQIDYFNNYKVVSVFNAADGSVAYEAVLVQCGTPAPDAAEFSEDAVFVEVPVARVITLSTTHAVHLVELGRVDSLVGLDSFLYVSAPDVRERIAAGELIEVSPGFEFSLEAVLDAEPDIVITDGFDPGRLTQLADLGIAPVLNTEYQELTPLGYAEWIKQTAVFYNAEAAANEIFDSIVAEYNAIIDLTADIPDAERPRVLWNAPFDGSWFIPGLETFPARLIEDAGGLVAVAESEGFAQSTPYALEAVYDLASDADIWIANLFATNTLDDFLAQDSRYADFEAVQQGNVWNNDGDTNVNGGNNYYELGVTNPHLILADLIAMFHPELAPEDYELNFFRRLEPSE